MGKNTNEPTLFKVINLIVTNLPEIVDIAVAVGEDIKKERQRQVLRWKRFTLGLTFNEKKRL